MSEKSGWRRRSLRPTSVSRASPCGLAGVLLLSIAHGMYVRLLYEWLAVRSVFVIGAGCYVVVILLNHDFFGVFQMFLAHTRQLVVWPLVLYFMSRRSG